MGQKEGLTCLKCDRPRKLSVPHCIVAESPTRRRATMCWFCDHPDATWDDYLDLVREKIARFGWATQHVERDGIHPPWSYTVGLTELDEPELVVTGLPMERASALLHRVVGHTPYHAIPEPGEQVELPGGPLIQIVEVAEPSAHLEIAVDLYGPLIHAVHEYMPMIAATGRGRPGTAASGAVSPCSETCPLPRLRPLQRRRQPPPRQCQPPRRQRRPPPCPRQHRPPPLPRSAPARWSGRSPAGHRESGEELADLSGDPLEPPSRRPSYLALPQTTSSTHNMGADDSKRLTNQATPTRLLDLPPEAILCIADFLPAHSAASLAFCNHSLSQVLGPQCWKPLRQHNHEARIAFLSALAKDLPGYFVCHICSLLHLSGQGTTT